MMRLILLAACACFALPSPALAWNATGHSLIALMAYRELSDADQKKVQTILKAHPHYNEYLTNKIPANANRDEWIVMQASTWPDWVKGSGKDSSKDVKSKYNHSDWHYINIPIRMLEGASKEDRAAIEKNIGDPKKKRGQILTIIPRALAGMKSPKTTQEEKAVDLAWALHLIGDLHQPLHAATYFSKDSHDGDLGGNLFYVRRGSQPIRLHSMWDDSLGGFQSFPVLDEYARLIRKQHPITTEERAITDPRAWAAESHKLAESVAYRFNGNLIHGALTHGFLDKAPDKAPQLPEGYDTKMRETSRKRASLGAARLAEAIKASLSDQ